MKGRHRRRGGRARRAGSPAGKAGNSVRKGRHRTMRGRRRNMKGKGLLRKLLLAAALVAFLLSPLSSMARSLAVMAPYSLLCYQRSVLKQEGIRLRIPGGISTLKSDWYPIVITFNDDEGMSRYLGEDVRFTVLYSFGHYDHFKGSSVYYDPISPYFSSFYGGYIIKPEDGTRRFGFNKDGTVNTTELAKVPEYDQLYLVLSSLGCPGDKLLFKSTDALIEYDVEYAGFSGWVRIDSNIRTSSPVHEYKEFHQAYLQYGKPFIRQKDKAGLEEFYAVTLRGRAYARYFEEFKATIVLYIMAPSWTTVEECDSMLLSRTRIQWTQSDGAGR